MIGFTKLLCGTATVSDIIRQRGGAGQLPPHMLQFSTENTPVVVWNMTHRCNLYCRHCYISADTQAFTDELSTKEAEKMIDDLAKMRVPVLLFSGGEPLLRQDIFSLGEYAAQRGLRPVLSTNGTLITPATAENIHEAGFQYVGISLDGARITHDRFRGRQGAFDEAIAGLRCSMAAGNKTGIRFTVNKWNIGNLPEILSIVERERIQRFCLYHLVYAGRGKDMAQWDTTPAEKRRMMNYLIEKTLDFYRRGVETEILTTDNHADGLYILDYVRRNIPARVPEVEQLLKMHGGCSAGQKMANIDPHGCVHACQFWSDVSLGNVRERPFSAIWRDAGNGFLQALRGKSDRIQGRCGQCRDKELCGGCRIRAHTAGNLWGEDPACYLIAGSEEIPS